MLPREAFKITEAGCPVQACRRYPLAPRCSSPSSTNLVAASRRRLLQSLVFGVGVALGWPGSRKTRAHALRQDGANISPVALRIPRALIDAPLEPKRIAEGTLQDPSGVWADVWYMESGHLDVPGNVLVYGYPNWEGVGPALFQFLVYLRGGAQADAAATTATPTTFALAPSSCSPRMSHWWR